MIALFRQYLPPYRWPIVLVLLLLLIQAIANLYLPDLNADIINNGVAKGDTDYILRTGALMLVVTFVAGDRRRSSPSTSAPRSRWASAATSAAAIFRKVETFSPGRGQHTSARRSLITRNTNDVQQVQTVVLMGLTMMISAPDHDRSAASSWPSARTSRCPALLLVILPLMVLVIGLVDEPRDPAVPGDADQDRPHQPGDARDALGRPRHPRVRAHRARGGALRRARTCDLFGHGPAGQPAVRDHASRSLMAIINLSHRRGHVVRARCASTAARCPSAT